MPTTHLGRADEVNVIGDENGFELHIHTPEGSYVVNVHAIAEELLNEVDNQIGSWLDEGGRAAEERRHDDEQRDAYDLRNPKHPDFHSVHADLYDSLKTSPADQMRAFNKALRRANQLGRGKA